MTDITLFGPMQISIFYPDFDKNYLQHCIDQASNFTGPLDYQTNVKGKMSDWQIWKQTDTYNLIIQTILNRTEKCSWIRSLKSEFYSIESCWLAKYEKGDLAIRHDHFPSPASFVYFLKAGGGTPLIFEEFNYKIDPVDNLLVWFPGHVQHHVPVHNSDESRIVLAGNLILNRPFSEE